MTTPKGPPPPDQAARDRIRRDLGTTFLVEAGAGSGKTTSLVDRMIALLAEGRTAIDTLAAVTFTRKAAAELRGRFQVALERERLEAKDSAVRARLDGALTGLERSFIGTIHSFCARLLRERPVEAGIDPEFRELEEHEDAVLLEKSWDEYLAKARLENEAALRGLDEAGLNPSELESAFRTVSEFPDVEAVPGRSGPPEFGAVRGALEGLVDMASALVPKERPGKGRDALQSLFVRLFRRRRNIGFADGRRLMESVELFDKKLCVTKNRWGSKDDAARLLAAAESFQETVARPALREWREFRHTKALAFLGPAIAFYAERRRAEARLNFQDLLMRTAKLLRDNPEVRGHFRERFHPVLVDEFQDTDPIQAEILFLLAGTDDAEPDWTKLAPAPGSLFLVGDPKQSIFRFRRADIDIYNLVKDRIEASGGETLALSANFRSLRSIADWVDPLFDPGRGGVFPAVADAYQAGFMPLETVRGQGRGSLSGVRKITLPAVPYHAKDEITELDSERVAGFIAWALAGNLRLDDGDGGSREAAPGDFLVLFRYKDRMGKYARRLEELGVPFEITGSDAFSENAEIAEVMNLLLALDDPDDPVATVAVLRGLLFGLSDQDLLDHRAAGGDFCYLGAAGGTTGSAKARRAFAVLRGWREVATKVPPSVALETILQSSGLLCHLVTAEMGSSRAGNILKLVEVLRGRESQDMTSFAAAVAFLAEWIGAQPVEEMCLAPGRRNVVRLMNLHKAKGLEARVVWLANPAGVPDFEPDRHIRRTGGKPLGHFRFSRPAGYQSKTVSQPAEWDESASEERIYEEAEENRLMYVAATRARDLLVVSSYAGNLGERRSWGPLERGLVGVIELQGSPPARGAAALCPAPSGRKKSAVGPKDANEGRAALRRRMAEASRAGSLHETVTALAKRDREPPEWARGGLGTWGSEVHVMLRTLGESWPSDGRGDPGILASEERLTRMARDVLVAAERNPGDCRELARHIAAVVRSGFWLRAMRAERRLFEVPFSIRVRPREAGYDELAARVGSVPVAGGRPIVPRPEAPIFLSGAVDLLFRESGWVLADFKTDRPPRALAGAGETETQVFLDSLAAYYRPQVELYTRFWAKLTGEKVSESGLYFTALDRWVPIDAG
jgi:ATP-dependent helicase/nuclease subunit A